jgi:hypothetical protein
MYEASVSSDASSALTPGSPALERGDRHLNAMRRRDYLNATPEDRPEDDMAIFAAPEPEPESGSAQNARSCELRELSLEERHPVEQGGSREAWRMPATPGPPTHSAETSPVQERSPRQIRRRRDDEWIQA